MKTIKQIDVSNLTFEQLEQLPKKYPEAIGAIVLERKVIWKGFRRKDVVLAKIEVEDGR